MFDINAIVFIKSSGSFFNDQIYQFPLNTLMDFGKLMGDEAFTDVKLITKGGAILAHKAILAARSPVEIPTDRDAVEVMLHFIHYGHLKNIVSQEEALLHLSNMNFFDDLKVLYKKISIENAIVLFK